MAKMADFGLILYLVEQQWFAEKSMSIENQRVSFPFPIHWFSIVYPLVFDRAGNGLRCSNQWIDDRKLVPARSKTSGLEIEGCRWRFPRLLFL